MYDIDTKIISLFSEILSILIIIRYLAECAGILRTTTDQLTPKVFDILHILCGGQFTLIEINL